MTDYFLGQVDTDDERVDADPPKVFGFESMKGRGGPSGNRLVQIEILRLQVS